MWKINGIDITEAFGVLLKKGAYQGLLSIPSMKTYLTEDVREYDGEKVLVENERMQARSVSLPCVLVADGQSDYWAKYDAFVKFISSAGLFEFKLEKHNRTYRFYYQDCSDFSNLRPIAGSSKKYSDFVLNLREPNPRNVTKEDVLQAESGADVTSEDNKTINVNINIYAI